MYHFDDDCVYKSFLRYSCVLGHRNNKVNSEKNCLSAFVGTNKSIIAFVAKKLR
jgi:hypothetical protein